MSTSTPTIAVTPARPSNWARAALALFYAVVGVLILLLCIAGMDLFAGEGGGRERTTGPASAV